MNIEHDYTRKILAAFAQISQVPRPSKREEKIVAWMINWAAENGLEARTDDAMNVLIEVPATAGCMVDGIMDQGAQTPYGRNP